MRLAGCCGVAADEKRGPATDSKNGSPTNAVPLRRKWRRVGDDEFFMVYGISYALMTTLVTWIETLGIEQERE